MVVTAKFLKGNLKFVGKADTGLWLKPRQHLNGIPKLFQFSLCLLFYFPVMPVVGASFVADLQGQQFLMCNRMVFIK